MYETKHSEERGPEVKKRDDDCHHPEKTKKEMRKNFFSLRLTRK
jgi:hypothetical protein